MALLLLLIAWWAWERLPLGLDDGLTDGAPEAIPAVRVASSKDAVYYGPPESLAVLPFADASAGAGQQAQAYGFAAELIARLQQVPGLQVAARSSSFFFRDAAASPRIVSERLQSRFLLTGEWRAAGDAFTVTVALFDARRNEEVWRREMGAPLSEVRRAQGDLAVAVLDALPSIRPPNWPPAPVVAPEDWALLQAGRLAADPLGPPDLAAAAAALQRVLERRPDYDAARLALAELWLHPAWPPGEAGQGAEAARAAAQRVLDRGPAASAADRAQAWGLMSYLLHDKEWLWEEAAEAAGFALELAPGDAGLLALASQVHFTLGRLERARELLQDSIRRDPLNLGTRRRLGLAEEFSGLYDDALATYRQVLSLRPDYPGAHAYRARIKVLQDNPESALRESAQESEPFWKRYSEALALVAAERQTEADALVERMMEEDGSVAAFQLAELLAYEGETDRAFEWLDRAVAQRDPGVSALLRNPLLENLRSDARWPALLESLGLPLDSLD